MSYNANAGYEPDNLEADSTKDTELYTIELNETKIDKDNKSEYNPFDHRDVEHPTTNAETLLHLLKGSLGTGILAMPHAFSQSGYVLGIAGTLIVGLLCLYCVHLLIDAEYELCKRKKIPSMSYPATASAALLEGPPFLRRFAGAAPHIVNGFLLIYQMGTCCVYTVFMAENTKTVLDEYIGHYSISYYILAFLIPLILINWIRNLKYLAPFSTVANGITVVCFAIIVYYLSEQKPSIDNKVAFGTISNLPLFFGTVLFALEAIGVIMPLENEMKTPEAFGGMCGVLNIGMFTIIILYIMMGCLGYLAIGSKVSESITLDIVDNVLGNIVKISLALAIFITHALQCYVAVDIAWNGYFSKRLEKNNRKLLWEYGLRTSIVIFTLLLAIAIPKLGLFISLFGAFCLSALGIAIPAIVDTATFWYTYTDHRFKLMVAKNIFLVAFGILGLVVGTYTSMEQIIKEL